jgi:hypothetical protein
MPTSTYTPLATVTLGSSASSVTISSIPATYRDLILVTNGTSTSSGGNMTVRLNNDSASNYSEVFMYGTGSSVLSGTLTPAFFEFGAYGTTTPSISVVQIMDYSATDKHKTVIARTDAPANYPIAYAARWANTVAVTSVVFSLTNSVSYATGTTFNLYGVIA